MASQFQTNDDQFGKKSNDFRRRKLTHMIDQHSELTDKEFLQWIHDRLEFVYKENKTYDYMYRLKAIIDNYSDKKTTRRKIL